MRLANPCLSLSCPLPSAGARTNWLGTLARLCRQATVAALAGLAMGLVSLPTPAQAADAPVALVTIDKADAVSEDGAPWSRFPSDKATRSVTLPDEWSTSRPQENAPTWYRARFDRPQGTGITRWSLLIDEACANATVLVNGEIVHQVGSVEAPYSRRCRVPIHVALPQALLRDQGNLLELRLVGHAIQEVGSDTRAAYLSTIHFGPTDVLADEASRSTWWRVHLSQISGALLALLGVVLWMLGRVDRNDSHLSYFGAFAVLAAVATARHWWLDMPLSNFLAEAAFVALAPLMTWAGVEFFLRYAGWRSKPIQIALIAQVVIVVLTVLLAGRWRMHTITSSWLVLLTTEVIVAAGIYLWTMWHRDRRQFYFMSLLCGTGVALTLMLLLRQQDRGSTGFDLIAGHGLTLLLMVLGLRLFRQFGQELQVSEASRRSTELRVREATLEIEKNFAQLAELRVEQVTAQERKRIAGDLHDDLGAKLLTIVHTSDNERISSLAREALEEMRLSVRGLTGKPMKLIDALGDWRVEFIQRLAQTGLESDWENPADDELPQTLSARAYVQTTRILREAVNNIIKHSGASHCSVTVNISGTDFQLAIQDNGKGIPMEVDGRLDRGHGMASMKHRAKQLHGQCLFESAPGYGTVIRLTLPLDRHVEPS